MGGKHKKTRKEKIIADYRHNTYILGSKSFPTLNPNAVNNLVPSNSHSYSYVGEGVLKTTILTAAIIIGEIILFFLLKNQTITLPTIRY